MTNEEIGRGICQFCKKTITTVAKLDEHLKTAHSSTKPQLEMEDDRPGLEPADRKPTTEIPPGAEDVNQSGGAQRN
jgi:hypothetical protein